MAWQTGDKIRLTATFTDINGDNADPTAVTLKVRAPGGATTTYSSGAELTNSGTGVYYYELSLTTAGAWVYRFQGTGAVEASTADEKLIVDESVFD